MADTKTCESMEGFLLKECYDLAASCEAQCESREVLKEKSRRLNITDDFIPVQEDAAIPETVMQIATEALYALSHENPETKENAEFRYAHKIAQMPDCGEKEYLLALLSLRAGTSESRRIDALVHIGNALGYSPEDPRYIALAVVLQNANK